MIFDSFICSLPINPPTSICGNASLPKIPPRLGLLLPQADFAEPDLLRRIVLDGQAELPSLGTKAARPENVDDADRRQPLALRQERRLGQDAPWSRCFPVGVGLHVDKE